MPLTALVVRDPEGSVKLPLASTDNAVLPASDTANVLAVADTEDPARDRLPDGTVIPFVPFTLSAPVTARSAATETPAPKVAVLTVDKVFSMEVPVTASDPREAAADTVRLCVAMRPPTKEFPDTFELDASSGPHVSACWNTAAPDTASPPPTDVSPWSDAGPLTVTLLAETGPATDTLDEKTAFPATATP